MKIENNINNTTTDQLIDKIEKLTKKIEKIEENVTRLDTGSTEIASEKELKKALFKAYFEEDDIFGLSKIGLLCNNLFQVILNIYNYIILFFPMLFTLIKDNLIVSFILIDILLTIIYIFIQIYIIINFKFLLF